MTEVLCRIATKDHAVIFRRNKKSRCFVLLGRVIPILVNSNIVFCTVLISKLVVLVFRPVDLISNPVHQIFALELVTVHLIWMTFFLTILSAVPL